jgi:hypothetical protein
MRKTSMCLAVSTAALFLSGTVFIQVDEQRVQSVIQQRKSFENISANFQRSLAQKSKQDNSGVKITDLQETIEVRINNELFTEYNFKDVPRPYFYPVIGPTGVNMTRHWPLKEGMPNEEHDHIHHRSLWFTHGDVNGHDFWTERKGNKVVHDKFIELSSSRDKGVIKSQNKWIAKSGETVCTDTRTHTFYNTCDGLIMDFDITIHASEGKVIMGDTKEGTMAIRVAPTLRLKGPVAKGHIVTSAGIRDEKAWGTLAAWCDYWGPLEDQVVGVAIFNHPKNPRHPTWWMARDYGLFTANPFGAHYFENKPEGTGDIIIEAGKDLNFKYRFYFHKGNEIQAKVAERYEEYINTIP